MKTFKPSWTEFDSSYGGEMNAEFHADDVFGAHEFTPQDLPLLRAALSKVTPWTPEERQVVELALEAHQKAQEARAWALATDLVVNNLGGGL